MTRTTTTTMIAATTTIATTTPNMAASDKPRCLDEAPPIQTNPQNGKKTEVLRIWSVVAYQEVHVQNLIRIFSVDVWHRETYSDIESLNVLNDYSRCICLINLRRQSDDDIDTDTDTDFIKHRPLLAAEELNI